MAVVTARSASAQVVSTSSPPAAFFGWVSRMSEVRRLKPKRPLSQLQASLTAMLVRASWRWIWPRRDWTVRLQPAEQWSQTLGALRMSNGRALNR